MQRQVPRHSAGDGQRALRFPKFAHKRQRSPPTSGRARGFRAQARTMCARTSEKSGLPLLIAPAPPISLYTSRYCAGSGMLLVAYLASHTPSHATNPETPVQLGGLGHYGAERRKSCDQFAYRALSVSLNLRISMERNFHVLNARLNACQNSLYHRGTNRPNAAAPHHDSFSSTLNNNSPIRMGYQRE